MLYKYCSNMNFEDYACGRVIIHKNGYPNFPVRLAQEIFSICLNYIDISDDICIYDPCCGGGYMLTVLGFLNIETIKSIKASDINDEAVRLAQDNLTLLDTSGLKRRIQHINDMATLHNKTSHIEALDSGKRLLDILENTDHQIQCEVFRTDILSRNAFVNQNFKADVVFTDVPYGNLVVWENRNDKKANLLDNLIPILKKSSVVAICSDKSQIFKSDYFIRLKKQIIGKRMFQIFKLI